MISSANSDQKDPLIHPNDLGVVAGVTLGLGVLALFGTPKGKQVSQWLVKTAGEIRGELADFKATPRSKTYQELSTILETLKNGGPTPTRRPEGWMRAVKNQLFATETNRTPEVMGLKKKSNRYFHQTVRGSGKSSVNHKKSG